MKKIVFVTLPDAEHGFSLAGITHFTIRPEGTEETLRKVINDENGLVIVDERLIKNTPEERLREIERGWRGVLLVLPAPEMPGAVAEDYIYRLIRRAIGYHVRLQQ